MMGRERWYRGDHGDVDAFDWDQPATELHVPLEQAYALYEEAVAQAARPGSRRAEELYLDWLKRAASQRRRAPGKRMRTMRVVDPAERGRRQPRPESEPITPGKRTRTMSAADEAGSRLPQARLDGAPIAPGKRVQSAALVSRAEARSPAAEPAALQDQLVEMVTSGRGTADVLAAADPATAATVLGELRNARVPGQTAPALQLVARTAGGEVARVLGRSSAGNALPRDLAARLRLHVGEDAASAARLHTDDTADLVATAHHAHAVTFGSDIYFARGQYDPGTARGDELLAHELTHVAQGRRGELSRAAAKGIDSGGPLDPAEAEADLRARLAVIQLHAPDGPVPQLAAPSGQPTSDGDRAARLAAQQQRITQADQPEPALADPPAPAASTPQAPVPHPPPTLTAPPVPAATGNAYIDAFLAPPSRQATELWAQAGTQATTQAAADQARFDAGLSPMPIVLDGRDAPAAQGGASGASAGAGPGATPSSAAGTTPPDVQPAATPAPPVTTDQPSAPSIPTGADPAQAQANAQAALDALPTTAPDVETAPGPAPVTDLAGQADPVRTLGDHRQAITDGARALDDARTRIVAGPGPAQVQPVKLDEKLTVPAVQAAGPMPALLPVDGMAKFKQWNLPGNAQASFDEIAKPKMDANLAQAKAQMLQAEATHDTDRAKAVTDAQDKVKQAHIDADAQQQAKVAETRTRIANQQADALLQHGAEVKKLNQQAGDQKKTTIGKINDRISADQTKVDNDFKDAQQRADDRKQQGEADAARKKQEAQDQAGNQSWWDQFVGAISDAIQSIANDINQILTDIGTAIGQILDDVKNAACAVIDAARDFVCQTLTEFGDWLKSAVDTLIGSVFPELAAALDQMIDQAVDDAKTAVNAIADDLKQGVTALCDGLKATIDGVIAAFKTAVQAAATLAQAAITGDWGLVAKMVIDGILNALGIDPAAFYALVGKAQDSLDKIVENPGAFVGHLVDAVKLGFQQFGTNFWTHLQDGLAQWLFGTFAQAGIRMPASFDLAGIFDLVCQILGLTWPRLRGKVVDLIGEENTERLELVAGYLEALVTKGFAGLWEKVQQDLSNLWNMVVGGVRDWLIQNVVQQAILKLATMWNPVGAIFELIQTAWNAYQWLRQNAQRIFGLVEAVVNSISNIVAGDITGAANFVEASLARLVPIAISLFADLLGLGGIGEQIRSIIEQVQSAVDQAIDALIERVMAMFRGGDEDGDDDEANEEPEVPTSLVEPSPVTLDQVSPTLATDLSASLAENPSGNLIYQADTTEPEEVTRNLLANHPDAQLDPESHQLTLPPISSGVLEQAGSLQELGQTITQETGVSKATITRVDGKIEIHGHINPETKIAELIQQNRETVLAMLKRIAEEFWALHLDRRSNAAAHNADMQRMGGDAKTYGARGPNENAPVFLPSRPSDDLRLAANQVTANAKDKNATQDVLHAPAPSPTPSPTERDTAVTSQTREGRRGMTQTVNEDGTLAEGQSYDELIDALSQQHSPQQIARALDTLRNGGGIDPEFTDQADELATLRNLLFNVEVQRDRRNLIFSPMTTDLLAQGVPMDDLLGNEDGLHPATMESAAAGYSPDGRFYNPPVYTSLGDTNEERDARLPELREENRRRQIELLTTWFQAAVDAGAVPAEGSLEDLEAFIRRWVEAHYGLAAQETGSEPAPGDGQDGA